MMDDIRLPCVGAASVDHGFEPLISEFDGRGKHGPLVHGQDARNAIATVYGRVAFLDGTEVFIAATFASPAL